MEGFGGHNEIEWLTKLMNNFVICITIGEKNKARVIVARSNPNREIKFHLATLEKDL